MTPKNLKLFKWGLIALLITTAVVGNIVLFQSRDNEQSDLEIKQAQQASRANETQSDTMYPAEPNTATFVPEDTSASDVVIPTTTAPPPDSSDLSEKEAVPVALAVDAISAGKYEEAAKIIDDYATANGGYQATQVGRMALIAIDNGILTNLNYVTEPELIPNLVSNIKDPEIFIRTVSALDVDTAEHFYLDNNDYFIPFDPVSDTFKFSGVDIEGKSVHLAETRVTFEFFYNKDKCSVTLTRESSDRPWSIANLDFITNIDDNKPLKVYQDALRSTTP